MYIPCYINTIFIMPLSVSDERYDIKEKHINCEK